MSKSVFLKVTGDDYAALTFLQNFDPIETYREMLKYNIVIKEISYSDEWNDDINITVTIHEFKEVDPKFVDFAIDVLGDYDSQKHTDFYRVV